MLHTCIISMISSAYDREDRCCYHSVHNDLHHVCELQHVHQANTTIVVPASSICGACQQHEAHPIMWHVLALALVLQSASIICVSYLPCTDGTNASAVASCM